MVGKVLVCFYVFWWILVCFYVSFGRVRMVLVGFDMCVWLILMCFDKSLIGVVWMFVFVLDGFGCVLMFLDGFDVF